jgi:hypothetical protein
MAAQGRSRKARKHVVPLPLPLSLESSVVTGTVLGLAALAAPASAATFNVTNLNDSGAGSLRQATLDASASAGADVVTFQPGLTGTITLTTGPLLIDDALDVQGPGEAVLTVDGNNATSVFYIYSTPPALVTISQLTVAHGNHSYGGAIVAGGNLTLSHVTVQNSSAFIGGGVGFGGPGALQILNSTITGNDAFAGGGVFLYGNGAPSVIQDSVISGNTAILGGGLFVNYLYADLAVSRTSISGNSASGAGGGIFLYETTGGQFTLDSSTISGNSATGPGGGIFFYSASDPIEIVNSTITGNQAADGGGIYFYISGGAMDISFSTISGNTASGSGGNVYLYGYTTVTLENSIIADGTAPADPDIHGAVFNSTYSLIETPGSAVLNSGTGTITGQDPQLGPLANNGGPTMTQLPAPTSPVIDAGDPAYAPPPSLDQRGFPRLAGAAVDMGAVEVNGGVLQFSATTYSVNENGGSLTVTVTRTGGTEPATVNYTTSNGTATAGADYTTTSGTLSFTAGQTSATFNVPILDDNAVEGNETFSVTLSAPSPGATIGAQNPAVVTIVDVENGVVQFASPTYTVAEDGGSITITVTRSGGSTGAVSVNYATSSGTATSGSDFTATSGTINFAAGDSTPKTIVVPITNDGVPEPPETFTVTLSAPTGGVTIGAQSTTAVTITAPAVEIPTLGFFGKILLMTMTALTGLWAVGRRRIFGFMLAMIFCGLAANSLQAQAKPATQSTKRHVPRFADPSHVKVARAGRVQGVIESVSEKGGITTVTLKSGATLAIADSALHVVDRSSGVKASRPLSSSALKPGQKVMIVTVPAHGHRPAKTKIKLLK